MRFECDPEKAKKNLKKNGVSFEEAVTIFYDPLSATFDDPDHSFGEYRYIAIGMSARERLLVVGPAERGESLRIINARTATAHERKKVGG